jgi:hypothetical protein
MITAIKSALASALIVIAIFCQSPTIADERAKAALEKPITCKLVSMPLKDLTAYLGESNNVNIVLAQGALKEAETKLSGEYKSVKLRTLLEIVLKPLNLTYAVTGDEIVIVPDNNAK